jgi:AraC-like DNA-binding protein
MTVDLRNMTERKPIRSRGEADTFFRYLPVSAGLREWGMYVASVGYSRIPEGHAYPPTRHPADHHFTWIQGRVLNATTLVYITRGQGLFESSASGSLKVQHGNLFVLFPGVWHRYSPDSATGWEEHWVEFDGDCARRFLAHKDLQPSAPVLNVGLDDRLVDLFGSMIDCVREEAYGFEYQLAAFALQVLALAIAAQGRQRFASDAVGAVVSRAKCILVENMTINVDLPALARELNVSYTWFRKVFKEYTGFSPRQFQLHHRIHRARQLLAGTTLPVGEIAERLGFQTVYYFSELFKRRMACSPQAYRNQGVSTRKTCRSETE